MNTKNEYWFKITKWNTTKPDFCRVYAIDEKHALYEMEDQLLTHNNINCKYFSLNSHYKRNINDIMNFELVSVDEVKKHIDKIQYAIQKQSQDLGVER